MRVLSTSTGELDVALSRDELTMINNALNEVCNGVDIMDFEFQTRLGWDRSELRSLLDQVYAALGSSN